MRPCCQMPTVEERLCCRRTISACVTKNDEYRRAVLDQAVIHVAMVYRNDNYVRSDVEPENNQLRHTAYRQYILWKHGHLGRAKE